MNKTTSGSQREIPPPPGGGSWRFDETAWAWQTNDVAPAPQPATAEEVAAPIAVPAAARPTTEE